MRRSLCRSRGVPDGQPRWASAPFTAGETYGRVALTRLLHDLDGQALLPQVMRQEGLEMIGDLSGRTTGGFKVGQILNLEVLRKANPAVGMKAVARHGCTLMG